jgi:signal transduction histidine kinase
MRSSSTRANHSAILFNGEERALTGDPLEQASVTFAPYRPEEVPTPPSRPTASGPPLPLPGLALHGKAEGATLVVFRWIGPPLRALARVDRTLAGMVLLGFLGTAAILAFVVHRAIRPVEEVTRMAEEAEASDLSRRVRVSSGGEEFRRLADVVNALFDRLERAFAGQRRLIADAAHELKTPTAVLPPRPATPCGPRPPTPSGAGRWRRSPRSRGGPRGDGLHY